MANFAHLLQKPADEIKKPEALPEGTYYGTLTNYELGESPAKKTPFIQFNIALSHAEDGLDLEGLEVGGRKTRTTFYLTDDAMWRLKEFLNKLGIQTEGRRLDELVAQTSGLSVMVELGKTPNRDGTDFYNECRSVSAPQAAEPEPQADAPVSRRRSA